MDPWRIWMKITVTKLQQNVMKLKPLYTAPVIIWVPITFLNSFDCPAELDAMPVVSICEFVA